MSTGVFQTRTRTVEAELVQDNETFIMQQTTTHLPYGIGRIVERQPVRIPFGKVVVCEPGAPTRELRTVLEVLTISEFNAKYEPTTTAIVPVRPHWRAELSERDAAKIAHAEDYAANHASAGVAGHSDFLLLAQLAEQLDERDGEYDED